MEKKINYYKDAIDYYHWGDLIGSDVIDIIIAYIPKTFVDATEYASYDAYKPNIDSYHINSITKVKSIPKELCSPNIFSKFVINYLVIQNQAQYFNTDLWCMLNTICWKYSKYDNYKNIEYFCSHCIKDIIKIINKADINSELNYKFNETFLAAGKYALELKDRLSQRNNKNYSEIIIRRVVIRTSCI